MTQKHKENVEACDAHTFLKTDSSSPRCLRNHRRLSPRIQQQQITPLAQTSYLGEPKRAFPLLQTDTHKLKNNGEQRREVSIFLGYLDK